MLLLRVGPSWTGTAFIRRRTMKTNLAFLAAVLGAGLAPRVVAQALNPFAMTGSMTTARMGHTATLLYNGKVLIAGGYQNVPGGQHCEGSLHFVGGIFLDCVSRLGTAELYDPATGTFSSTGNMTGLGLSNSATLLPSGKVLINWTWSAELYDPISGTFTAIDGLVPGGATAALLNNGKVLFAGSPATLYDPADGTVTSTGAYAGTPGSLGPATLLPDGRVLIEGSLGCCSDLGQTQIYDPISGTFSLTAAIFTESNGATNATLLESGKVLVTGGGNVNDDDYTPIGAGLYDPASGRFTVIGNLTIAREDGTATLLPNGSVFIAGGDFGPSSTEVYDPSGGRFQAAANMLSPRTAHTATLLRDGRVLIAGGLPGSPTTTSTAEVYTPSSLIPPPVLLSLSGDGTGQGAIQHVGNYQIASASNPAAAGEALVVYCTGLADGSVIPPQVTIGGRLAQVLWFGNTPGYFGLNQINVSVPQGVAPGPAVPVRIRYLNRPGNEVTVGVR